MAERSGFIAIQPKYEEIQFFFRKHWTHFMKPLIFGFIVGALTFLFFLVMGFFVMMFHITFFYSLFAFLLMIVSILFINIFFLQVINFFFDMVIVTDHRIIICKKTVFLKNDNDAIDLTKIQDIGVVAHGFLNNYLNYGTLLITLSTSMPPIMVNYVSNPHFYLEQMNRVKRANILSRQERRGSGTSELPARPETYLQPIDQL
jgi:hypothetical protein